MLNYAMKISNKSVKDGLTEIMDTETLSVDDVAAMTGVSRPTLYRIIDGKQQFVQRSIIRKIAEKTGRKFVIDGDSVRFVIVDKPVNDNLTQQEREFLDILRGLDDAGKDALIDLAGSIWRAEQLTKKRRKPSESSED